ncbi:HNH endonuclease [Knoellia flava TL1]|uniref:HNH domain-containing protein n=2 Tax=Knoellia flava TaxID=913969 RepID=A0A8H9FYP0_9MICO|nr:HNH endonuclease [Knoellia flava]KGN35206.1 HNH endonuclease [Knoellia flava TL1]GGB90041.1 hypothetical protein GCM10011314_32380 [Knoellia flava]
MARFDWTYDEVVLAASLVAQNAWQGLRVTSPKVVQLSELLRAAPIHPIEGRPDNFRSKSSVQRKTFDIATQHPNYTGKPTRGGPHDAEVLAAFISEPVPMAALAAAIRDQIIAPPDAAPADDSDLDELTAHEGRALAVTHLRRERNPMLRAAKLAAVTAKGLPIACEVCGFDFAARYGERGEGYIEVHHVLPLHASGPILTRLDDLALLCSNCHRMIHRGRPWLTPSALTGLMGGSS